MHRPHAPRKAIAPQSLAPSAGSSGVPAIAFAALVVANVALATGPLFVRLADTGPVAAGFWRMALALLVLGPAAVMTGRREPRVHRAPRPWWLLAIAGVAFAADLGAWHIGILHTTMANATLFGNSATFLFPLYGFLAARQWPTRVQGIALLLAVAGAALLMGRSYQHDPRHLVGDLLCLLAGTLYAIYFIVMSGVRKVMAPLPALALSSLAALPPMLGFAWYLREAIVPGDWMPLIALAAISQVIGQGCMIYALGRVPPLVVGLALLIQPVVATAIGWIGYDETLAGPDLLGIAMVAAALVLVRRGAGDATEEPTPPANPVTEDMR